MIEITEKIIGKAKLTPAEAKVARYYYSTRSCGKKTKKLVEAVSDEEFDELLSQARKKINKVLNSKRPEI